MARRNVHLSGRGHLPILRNPRGLPVHDPRTVSDRLDVDHALPAAARGVLHLDVGGDEGGENGRAELEDSLEGRVQVDVGGRVGGVRF